MNKQNRDALKQYFTTGKTPTQGQFADLIDSGINLIEDGLTIDSTGRLGVGTVAASARLSVQGAFDVPLAGTIAVAAAPGPGAGGMPIFPTDMRSFSAPSFATEPKIGSAVTAATGSGTGGTSVVAVATGVGTQFLSALSVGAQLKIGSLVFTVVTITSDELMTVHPPPTSALPASAALKQGPLLAITDADETMGLMVDEKGNVGIGTANPLAMLDVAGNVAALAFRGDGSALRNLAADRITSGTMDASRLPPLDASKITTGMMDPARLPAMGSGPVDAAQIPALDASKITTGKLIVQVIPNLDASLITSGYLSPDRLASKPSWQATIARPGGTNNTARCLIDFANFVHLTGSVDPRFSLLTGGTKNLLRMPGTCVPVEKQSFVILDNRGDPWQLDIPSAPEQDVSASYLGTATTPASPTLFLTGLSYAMF